MREVLRIVAKEGVPGPGCERGEAGIGKLAKARVSRRRRGEVALQRATPARPRAGTAGGCVTRNGARYAACALLSSAKDSTAG